jgi:hypothetical protein
MLTATPYLITHALSLQNMIDILYQKEVLIILNTLNEPFKSSNFFGLLRVQFFGMFKKYPIEAYCFDGSSLKNCKICAKYAHILFPPPAPWDLCTIRHQHHIKRENKKQII